MIVIIDNSMGNSGSVLNMIRRSGGEAVISSDPEIISEASKIILPGVGAFDNGVKNLKAASFYPVLKRKVLAEKIPFLGICLGMQMLFEHSDEGSLDGLGWIKGKVSRFKFDEKVGGELKIPHMGWNITRPIKDNFILPFTDEEYRFYYVHSYHVECADQKDVLAIANYGYDFVCAVQRNNIVGVQFHPEKSHRFGMALIRNFIEF